MLVCGECHKPHPASKCRLLRTLAIKEENLIDENEQNIPLSWQKAKILSMLLASVLVPVAIATVGHFINSAIKKNELELKYIEMAIEILRDRPNDNNTNIREWAINIVNEYAEVKLSPEARNELKEKRIAIMESDMEFHRVLRLLSQRRSNGDITKEEYGKELEELYESRKSHFNNLNGAAR